jgi:hypothetical protein
MGFLTSVRRDEVKVLRMADRNDPAKRLRLLQVYQPVNTRLKENPIFGASRPAADTAGGSWGAGMALASLLLYPGGKPVDKQEKWDYGFLTTGGDSAPEITAVGEWATGVV